MSPTDYWIALSVANWRGLLLAARSDLEQLSQPFAPPPEREETTNTAI